MKKILLMILLLLILAVPARAQEFTAPEVSGEAKSYFTPPSGSFGSDVIKIIVKALDSLRPGWTDALKSCGLIIASVTAVSLVKGFDGQKNSIPDLVGVLLVSTIVIAPSGSLIRLGVDTVKELSEYGKMLLPALTAALAAQGGGVTSAALYVGTMAFDTVLTFTVEKLVVPLVYAYLCLCIANRVSGDHTLNALQKSTRSLTVWILKLLVFAFTGYITVTGVVSGTADAVAVKAAKLTISGAVPVIGGTVADASEAILTGAAVMKNSVGIYGLLALISILIGPFLKIGIRYLTLKLTAGLCESFGSEQTTGIIQDFTSAMGIILAMTGVCCLLHMISTVCFMKGLNGG